MSALRKALGRVDGVADEGDLRGTEFDLPTLEGSCDPITLADGRRIFPPTLHGEPISSSTMRCATARPTATLRGDATAVATTRAASG